MNSQDAGEIRSHDAIILTGGGGRRLGGVDKARLTVGGASLLERSLQGLPAARRIVVVGPGPVPDGVLLAIEDPPGGGPAAGIAAGLALLERPGTTAPADAATWVVILAVDQPGSPAAVATILATLDDLPEEVDAVCHRDESGRPQWLLAAYRRDRLHHALRVHGSCHGVPVRRVLAPLRFHYLSTGADQTGDIDTWADHARWERRLGPA